MVAVAVGCNQRVGAKPPPTFTLCTTSTSCCFTLPLWPLTFTHTSYHQCSCGYSPSLLSFSRASTAPDFPPPAPCSRSGSQCQCRRHSPWRLLSDLICQPAHLGSKTRRDWRRGVLWHTWSSQQHCPTALNMSFTAPTYFSTTPNATSLGKYCRNTLSSFLASTTGAYFGIDAIPTKYGPVSRVSPVPLLFNEYGGCAIEF